MKQNIHPTYFPEAQYACSCGNMFTTGSTKKEVHVEICYKCHPIYTGEKRYVDTLGQVEKFKKKQTRAQKMKKRMTKKGKEKVKKEDYRPKTLRELLTGI